ncbi:MAG: hypothetical protein ACRENZ_11865 [Thermodesulfobacteriota bacterium]
MAQYLLRRREVAATRDDNLTRRLLHPLRGVYTEVSKCSGFLAMTLL